MNVLFSPHHDDETLFAAFTILRHHPHVVVCYPSTRDYGSTTARLVETHMAAHELGASGVEQWQGVDLVAQMLALHERLHPTRVWAPHGLASHPDHVAVADAAALVFGDRLTRYHTYTVDGKVRLGTPVLPEPAWVLAKLRALARYQTQATHPRAHVFFLQDLTEYIEEHAA